MLLYFASNFGAKIQLNINKIKRNQDFFYRPLAKNIESRIPGIRGMGAAERRQIGSRLSETEKESIASQPMTKKELK